jgi:hypothetical protein
MARCYSFPLFAGVGGELPSWNDRIVRPLETVLKGFAGTVRRHRYQGARTRGSGEALHFSVALPRHLKILYSFEAVNDVKLRKENRKNL